MTSPSNLWKRLGDRLGIGHRGAFLIAFGTIFFAIGVAVVLTPGERSPFLYHTHIPVELRVLLWCGTGAAAFAFSRNPQLQWLGFVALSIAPVERLTSYLGAVVIAVVPGGEQGAPLGTFVLGAALWVAIVFVTRLIASWPDPPGDAST